MLALNASGDLFAGFGAGPIQGAIGAEYRIEEGENIAETPPGTTDATRTDYLIQYGESFSGDVDVTEGYVEISLPLLKDEPFAQAPRLRPCGARIALQEQGQGRHHGPDEDPRHDDVEGLRRLGSARLAALPQHAVA